MAPHDLPYGYDPDISNSDVSYFELEAIGHFYHTNFDFESNEGEHFEIVNGDPNMIYDPDEDWESQYPPSTPYVPTPEVLAWVDNLIKELMDRANLITFGTTDPQENDYENFFNHFKTTKRHECHYRYYDDDDDNTNVSL